jgi:hypothetical protein
VDVEDHKLEIDETKERTERQERRKKTCARKEGHANVSSHLIRGTHPKLRWKCEKLWATHKTPKNQKTTKPENPKIRVLWLKYTNCGASVGEFFRSTSVFYCVFLIIRMTFYAVSDFSGRFEMGDPQVVFPFRLFFSKTARQTQETSLNFPIPP